MISFVKRIIVKAKYIYWKEGDWWLGYLEDYPDYLTQGATLKELMDNLRDLYLEFTSGNITAVRKRGMLEIAWNEKPWDRKSVV